MHKVISTLVLGASLTLGGCQQQIVKEAPLSKVELGPSSSNFIQVTSERAGIASSNLLRAGMSGINTSQASKELRYRFVWFDRDGFEINDLSSRWQYRTLPPKERFSLEMIATNPKSADYLIRIYDNARKSSNHSKGIEE
ncbi:YcfL family protein [Motiliproteus sp.]|uniref:YcfL family protein n=1 Tax=Motiliproteus sp. TaxID=1898955 RepID=UPI003BAD7D47